VATLPTLEEELEQLERPADMKKTVYVMHMPPANLGLDVCLNGEKVGSEAIYQFIKKNQPRLTVHGHIHESPEMSGKWKARLGRTLCVQPGQYGHMEDLVYAVIDVESLRCKRVRV